MVTTFSELLALNVEPRVNQRTALRRVLTGRRRDDAWSGVCRRDASNAARLNGPIVMIDAARQDRQERIDKAKLDARIDAIVRRKR